MSDKGNHNLSNGVVLTLSKIIKYVMSSAGETEEASSYLNCKAALPLTIALEDMGYPQPKTPLIVDNTSTQGLMTNTMTPKKSKQYDMQVNWPKCREYENRTCEKGNANRLYSPPCRDKLETASEDCYVYFDLPRKGNTRS